MMENGFSSPRSDRFNPAGLRVLVVDDDPTWLKILEKMLKKCSYEVTTCGLARDALSLLRDRKDGYDIVISDVNMPDMDGFKLLEHVGLEMDLPVIMMSVDGETSRVMKGVQHGACDYLLKPIRMKELRNIWQHVFRKKIHEVRDIENIEGAESIQISRGGSDLAEESLFFSGEDYNSMKKRKDSDNRHDDKDSADASSAKKARVVWSVDLHQKFVKAVDQIGYDKVGPKKILDLMNVPWLSRENVASHLQKYRLYLSRLQKENELKASVAGIKHTDSCSKDSIASFSFQNSANMQKSDLSNGSYGFSGCNSIIQNVSPKSLETEPKSMVAVPVVEPKRVLTVEIPNPREARRSQMSFDGSFAPLESENFATSDSIVPKQYSWCEAPAGQFNNENKALQLDHGFRQLPLQADHIQPAPPIISGPSLTEKDVEVESLYTNYNSKHANNPSPSGSVTKPFSVPTRADTVNHQAFEPISAATCNISDLVSAQTNINYVSGSSFPLVDENLRFSWSQGDLFPTNLGIQGIGFSDYDDPGLIPDIPFHLYDTLKFDYDHISDPTEYAVIDQGLFIA